MWRGITHIKHWLAISLYLISIIGFSYLSTVKIPRANADSVNPNNQFYIVGDKIIDPNGNIFLPIGANVGFHPNNFDWAGSALGHSAQAQAWGWNTIRLNFECTTAESYSEVTAAVGDSVLLKNIDQIVQEYTAKHIVVILECHDAQKNANDAANFWLDAAKKYKTNPYVWFNYANEPDYENQPQWVADQENWLKLVRSTGAENIFVADTLNAGNDAGWGGVAKVYDPAVGPAVAAGQCNVLFSLHNYGGQANSTDYIMRPQVYEDYWQKVQAANLAMIVGEYGLDYRLAFQTQANGTAKVISTNGSDPAKIAGDIYNHVANGEYATVHYANQYGIGSLAWHATFADNYRLATPINGITLASGASSGEPNFYNILNIQENSTAAGFTFTQEGQDLWNLGHSQPNLGSFTGSYSQSNCASAQGGTATTLPTNPISLEPIGSVASTAVSQPTSGPGAYLATVGTDPNPSQAPVVTTTASTASKTMAATTITTSPLTSTTSSEPVTSTAASAPIANSNSVPETHRESSSKNDLESMVLFRFANQSFTARKVGYIGSSTTCLFLLITIALYIRNIFITRRIYGRPSIQLDENHKPPVFYTKPEVKATTSSAKTYPSVTLPIQPGDTIEPRK